MPNAISPALDRIVHRAAAAPEASSSLEPAAGWGVAAAARLARDLESLEAALRAAERSASACRPGDTRSGLPVPRDDISSRLAELERQERDLVERERAVERHRIMLERVQERLLRGKDSLKRAIRRFRSQVARESEELHARSRRIAASHTESLETRRQLTREQIRLKTALRDQPALLNS